MADSPEQQRYTFFDCPNYKDWVKKKFENCGAPIFDKCRPGYVAPEPETEVEEAEPTGEPQSLQTSNPNLSKTSETSSENSSNENDRLPRSLTNLLDKINYNPDNYQDKSNSYNNNNLFPRRFPRSASEMISDAVNEALTTTKTILSEPAISGDLLIENPVNLPVVEEIISDQLPDILTTQANLLTMQQENMTSSSFPLMANNLTNPTLFTTTMQPAVQQQNVPVTQSAAELQKEADTRALNAFLGQIQFYSSIICFLLGTFGNALMIIIVIRGMLKMKNKTVHTSHIWILNLAVSDLLTVMFSIPLHTVIEAIPTFTLPEIACVGSESLSQLCDWVSMCSVFVMATTRAIGVLFPFDYKWLRQKKFNFGALAFIWFTGFLCIIPFIMYQKVTSICDIVYMARVDFWPKKCDQGNLENFPFPQTNLVYQDFEGRPENLTFCDKNNIEPLIKWEQFGYKEYQDDNPDVQRFGCDWSEFIDANIAYDQQPQYPEALSKFFVYSQEPGERPCGFGDHPRCTFEDWWVRSVDRSVGPSAVRVDGVKLIKDRGFN